MLDELLQYLVTEMAMDGEEGCSVARIDEFIETYCSRRRTQYPTHPVQLIDTAYKDFVWKSLCRLDQIRLGTLGQKSESFQGADRKVGQEVDEKPADEHLSPLVGAVTESKTLQLPMIVSNASNPLTQRKKRQSKGFNKRLQDEKAQTSSQLGSKVNPPLSIGQQRVLVTGNVRKNVSGPDFQKKKAPKHGKAQVKNLPMASSNSVWEDLAPDLVFLPRSELISKFGYDENGESRLRIAVDPRTCWRAVVGTESRNPKLTPYVYQVLCIVAQGREAGATVIELGQKLKHDQKSLFHFVKVLTDLQLVAKFRAYQHKAWTNRVVHQRYLATSEWYKDSVKKDGDSSLLSVSNETADPFKSSITLGHINSEVITPACGKVFCHESLNTRRTTIECIIESSENSDVIPVMSPITKEHLAVNGALIRSRLFTVLKRSPNHAMAHANIIKAIGIAEPTRDDRRRLNRYIDSNIKLGLLEKVTILNVNGHAPCIRLTELGETTMGNASVSASETMEFISGEDSEDELFFLPMTRSIGQTICDLLASSGENGMTYKDICRSLNDLEVRTVEQILTRMEREQPPPHLSDRRVKSVLESFGREKRVRWFDAESLKKRCQAAEIPIPLNSNEQQPNCVGEFLQIDASSVSSSFYENRRQLYKIPLRDPKGVWGKQQKKPSTIPGKIGRPRKYPLGSSKAERKAIKEKEEEAKNIDAVKKILKRPADSDPQQSVAMTTYTVGRPLKKVKFAKNSRPSETFIPTEAIPEPEVPSVINLTGTQLCSFENTAEDLNSVLTAQEIPKIDTIPQTVTELELEAESLKTASLVSQPNKISVVDVENLQNNSTHDNILSEAVVMCSINDATLFQPEKTSDLSSLSYFSKASIGSSTVDQSSRQNLTALNAGGIVERSHNLSKFVHDIENRVDKPRIVGLMDYRTLNATLYGLERRGELKSTTVLVKDALGSSFISLDSSEMTSWMSDFRARFTNTIHQTDDFEKKNDKNFVTLKPIPNKNKFESDLVAPVRDLNEESLRKSFLNQWPCISQLYGYIMGKASRAKVLHLYLLEAFQDVQNTPSACKMITTSGHRIFSSSFVFQELPVNLLVKLIPILKQSEEFENFIATPGSLNAPISKVPVAVRRVLQIGHTFARSKVFQIFQILCRLRVLLPLQKTTRVTEYYWDTLSGDRVYYSTCSAGFGENVFCLIDQGHIPLFCDVEPASSTTNWPLKTSSDGESYWAELRRVSIPELDHSLTPQSSIRANQGKFSQSAHRMALMLADQAKWYDEIQLTSTQKGYLSVFDDQNSDPPIDLEKDDEKIKHIAHVLATTPEAVKRELKYLRDARASHKKKKYRATVARKPKKKSNDQEIDAESLKLAQEEARKVLAGKAKNALQQKQDDWNSIINRFKQQSGVAEIDEGVLNDLHLLFIAPNQGINVSQLEAELEDWLKRKDTLQGTVGSGVEQSIKDAESSAMVDPNRVKELPMLPSVKAKRFKMLENLGSQKAQSERAVIKTLPDKPKKVCSIAARAIRPQLSAQIGMRPPELASTPGKRSRLDWNDTLDDFLEDMLAIIRARAYATCARVLPWSIALNVFKGSRTHLLKNRALKLERDDKERVYIELLTTAWTQLYFEKRGKVAELADPMPSIPARLDGERALDYLRANVDKGFLRAQAELMVNSQEIDSSIRLPDTLRDLRLKYRVKRIHFTRPAERWDRIHSALNLHDRECIIKNEAFSAPCTPAEVSRKPKISHTVSRACEALKLLTSTPVSSYSWEVATQILSRYSETDLVSATSHLCGIGVLTIAGKLMSYRYTDKFTVLPDARVNKEVVDTALRRIRNDWEASPDGELVWSLLANDTEVAALLSSISRGDVELKLNLERNREKRWKFDKFYRTRKLADGCIENEVSIKFNGSKGFQICELNLSTLSASQIESVRGAVYSAGPSGISAKRLTDLLSKKLSKDEVASAVSHLTKISPPGLYWAFEDGLVIFSSDYLNDWGECVNPLANEAHKRYLVGRVWYDLSGNLVEEIWKVNLCRVEGLIQNIPGISYAEILRKMNFFVNELELNDVLEELINSKKVSNDCIF
ncbi:hypothetical protein BY996DRAFT_6430814 [Phakopsora pachyrhizi]|nr:hypothetical protein BY996DRAFT_6430814 [Phakopsora pachyrhizi]